MKHFKISEDDQFCLDIITYNIYLCVNVTAGFLSFLALDLSILNWGWGWESGLQEMGCLLFPAEAAFALVLIPFWCGVFFVMGICQYIRAIKRQARDKLDDPAATTRKGTVLKLV